MKRSTSLFRPAAALLAGSLLLLIAGSGCKTPDPQTTNPHGNPADQSKERPVMHRSGVRPFDKNTTHPHGDS